MKTNSTLLAFLFVLFAFSTATAQTKRFGLSVGYETDMIKNLGAGYFQGTTTLDISDGIVQRFAGQNMYSGGCENLHFRLFGSLPITRFTNMNLTGAFVGVFNRADYMSYFDNDENTFYSFGSTSHEVALEVGIDKRLSLANFLYLDVGFGNNLGYGFGGRSNYSVSEHYLWEELETRSIGDMATGADFTNVTREPINLRSSGENLSSVNARLFGKVGFGLILFDAIEVGAAFRYGKGLRAYSGGYATSTTYSSFEVNSALRF